MIKVGNGLLLKIDFADGGVCEIDRTFLVIHVDKNTIHLLNVSSVKGKERKLGFASNKIIKRYIPPFKKPSFIKKDALYILPNDKWVEDKILCSNRCINPLELKEIIDEYEIYRENNEVYIKECTIDYLLEKNKEEILI